MLNRSALVGVVGRGSELPLSNWMCVPTPARAAVGIECPEWATTFVHDAPSPLRRGARALLQSGRPRLMFIRLPQLAHVSGVCGVSRRDIPVVLSQFDSARLLRRARD